MPLHEHVHARRECLTLRLEEPDGADVLLAAEGQLCFLLALRFAAPYRQRGGHQDRHHRQRHQQRGHRVTTLTP
jgi:hypothetical protein